VNFIDLIPPSVNISSRHELDRNTKANRSRAGEAAKKELPVRRIDLSNFQVATSVIACDVNRRIVLNLIRKHQPYENLQPFDAKFAPIVLLQVKNGPIDFQPREPFHPLFGAKPRTKLTPELQNTQEYLGFSNHFVFLASMRREFLDSETYARAWFDCQQSCRRDPSRQRLTQADVRRKFQRMGKCS